MSFFCAILLFLNEILCTENLRMQQELQRDVIVAKERIRLLEQQLQCLEDTYNETVAEEDNIQEVVKCSQTNLDQSRGLQKNACIQVRCKNFEFPK